MSRKCGGTQPARRSAGSSQRTHRGLRRPDVRAAVRGIRGEVRFHAPLRNVTSFRIGGPADALVVPVDVEAVVQVLRQARAAKCPVFVVGGTNLLIRDGGIRGIVVSLARFKKIHDEGDGTLYAEGGVAMPRLMQYALKRSLGGLEWAAGIPGTVAGCVVMNAGTRLGEMKSAVKAVRLVTSAGAVVDVPARAIEFGYRRTRMPPGVIVGVWLQLTPSTGDDARRVATQYLAYRKATQPLALPNAGCVFKNPGPAAAGELIERAGMKGARVGDAQVSEKHANFVVNLGKARAADVVALIKKVGRAVEAHTGVTLQLELKIVGEP